MVVNIGGMKNDGLNLYQGPSFVLYNTPYLFQEDFICNVVEFFTEWDVFEANVKQ